MPRLCVFLDYQNVYKNARNAFHEWDAPSWQGQIDPLRLGELLASKDTLNSPELSAVRVYRGRPDATRDPVGYGACMRQCSRWERTSDKVTVIARTLRYPTNWPEEKEEEKGIDVALAREWRSQHGAAARRTHAGLASAAITFGAAGSTNSIISGAPTRPDTRGQTADME